MNIDFIKGDLIDIAKSGDVHAIAHGCNCFHVMGAGIAKKINALTYGQALAADLETKYGDINKLGSYSRAYYNPVVPVVVYNLYTQYTLASKGHVAVYWEAVYNGLCSIIEEMESGETLAIPCIGCGLAGGNMDDFIQVLDAVQQSDEVLPDVNILVVHYEDS